MNETEVHYCYYHPHTPTSLRCNKCGKYICIKDARRTPVGYRCKECVRELQDTFFNATPVDYTITAVITLPIAYLAALIVPRLFWLALFAGPVVGIAIAEVIRVATRKRRGRYTWIVALACLLLGSLVPFWPLVDVVLAGALVAAPQLSGGILLNLGLSAIYLALAAGTLITRLRI
jgi:hypothetical protein